MKVIESPLKEKISGPEKYIGWSKMVLLIYD